MTIPIYLLERLVFNMYVYCSIILFLLLFYWSKKLIFKFVHFKKLRLQSFKQKAGFIQQILQSDYLQNLLSTFESISLLGT